MQEKLEKRERREKQMQDAGRKLLRFFYPLGCLVCGERIGSEENALCSACLARFEEECESHCRRCGNPHARCYCTLGGMPQIHLAPYHSEVTQRLILTAKDHVYADLLELFSERLSERLRKTVPQYGESVLCYVPRAPETVRIKGCDQSKLLAEAIAKKLKLPVVRAIYRRKAEGILFFRHATEQKMLTPSERKEAAARSYALTENAAPMIEGKAVYLVDDVITTGSTVSACAELLAQAGAAYITAVAVAKS